jgi:hypothetical protein
MFELNEEASRRPNSRFHNAGQRLAVLAATAAVALGGPATLGTSSANADPGTHTTPGLTQLRPREVEVDMGLKGSLCDFGLVLAGTVAAIVAREVLLGPKGR